MSFYKASGDCFCTTPCTLNVTVIKGLTFHHVVFLFSFVFLSFSYGIIWEPIMAIGELDELYGCMALYGGA